MIRTTARTRPQAQHKLFFRVQPKCQRPTIRESFSTCLFFIRKFPNFELPPVCIIQNMFVHSKKLEISTQNLDFPNKKNNVQAGCIAAPYRAAGMLLVWLAVTSLQGFYRLRHYPGTCGLSPGQVLLPEVVVVSNIFKKWSAWHGQTRTAIGIVFLAVR